MTDVRYYAVTKWGRQRLAAENLEEACEVVRTSPHLKSATRIIREERKTYELEPQ